MGLVLVVDLEATCCELGSTHTEQMEIIEVGAAWCTAEGSVLETFQAYVRPIKSPTLTTFCHELTGIKQEAVDSALAWAEVAPTFAAFVSRHNGQSWASWGAYDRQQIERECLLHQVANPMGDLSHLNLKSIFAKSRKIKQVGMARALNIVGLSLDGSHHRALSDVLNIAKLLPYCRTT
ncbi:MAG: 3'-5' exonuclease [Moraxellaceae bacterium]|nr:3'-5' exonuclease [Moraxellaceae bacterium]MDZ4387356.1 3'-5' exonuclease [Moraxellaceae bacterium]